MTHYIGIDVGGSAIKYALLDANGTIKETSKLPTPQNLPDFIKSLSEIQTTYSNVTTAGMAISMPGLIDAATGHAIHGGALTFIQDLNVRSLIQKACKVPVQIENDGKCAALGEHWVGNLVGVENGIALVIGTGIAGGIIVNNQLVRGHHLTAGEFSYIRTNSDSDDFQHLFAMEGSSIALSNTYADLKGLNNEQMDGKQFFANVAHQETDAVALLESYSNKLVVQIMNLQTILDPEVITIGGGISRQTLLFEAIDRHIDRLIANFPLPLVRPNVKQSTLGNNANLIGALKNFLDKEEH